MTHKVGDRLVVERDGYPPWTVTVTKVTEVPGGCEYEVQQFPNRTGATVGYFPLEEPL